MKDYKIICKMKIREMKKKKLIGVLNCTMDKLDRMVKIKHTLWVLFVPCENCLFVPCENSFWIMDLRIYEQGRNQILPSSTAPIGPLPRIQDTQGLY